MLTSVQGQGPYAHRLKKIENDMKDVQKRINEKLGAADSFIDMHRC